MRCIRCSSELRQYDYSNQRTLLIEWSFGCTKCKTFVGLSYHPADLIRTHQTTQRAQFALIATKENLIHQYLEQHNSTNAKSELLKLEESKNEFS